jgi:formylglycine-generating enzyme required for sulfatase activity
MVVVAEGTFHMGCNTKVDDQCQSDEFPYHQVHLSAFEIDEREATRGAYRACVEAGACARPWEEADIWNDQMSSLAMSTANYDMAVAFCGWVGKRLPTEAEWEKAARGVDGRRYPWGNSWDGCNSDGLGCFYPDPTGSATHDVSPYCALDMGSNAGEWVADWYAADYYADSPASDPLGPEDGGQHPRAYRILRGIFVPRVAARYYEWASTSLFNQSGFRCARSLTSSDGR